LRALLAQRFPVPGAPQANARRAAEIVAAADADLVVLPELWMSGYDLDRVHESALELEAAELGMPPPQSSSGSPSGGVTIVSPTRWP
jgi:predicted amidohydrolase